jgi:hypothetical protein
MEVFSSAGSLSLAWRGLVERRGEGTDLSWMAPLPARVQENFAMAKSGQIDSRSISAAADGVGRRRIAANPTLRSQRNNSTTVDASLSLSDGGGKIIHFYPRAIASQGQPALPMSNRKGEYNVIRFPRAASARSALQRWGETAKSPPDLVKNHGIQGDDDYDHRMLVNAIAAAVLVMLVISGERIFTTLATIP